MPSNMGPQRAASNPATSLSSTDFVRVRPDYRDLPARLCGACPGAKPMEYCGITVLFRVLALSTYGFKARSGPGAW